MLPIDVDREIERLKQRKMELTSKTGLHTSFDEKEDLEIEIKKIQKQIELLENLR